MQTISRGIKFRLYPSEEQKKILFHWRAGVRHIYNHYLHVMNDHFNTNLKHLSTEDRKGKYLNLSSKDVTKYRKEAGNEWLLDVPSVACQVAFDDLEAARKNAINPKLPQCQWPTKREWIDEFGIYTRVNGKSGPKTKCYIVFGQNSIKMGRTLGRVKYHKHKKIKGKLAANARIKYEPSSDRWYLSVVEEIEVTKPIQPASDNPIGIDVGIKRNLVTSEDVEYNVYRHTDLEKRIKDTQRVISRRVKGSNRRRKVKVEYAKLKRRQTAAIQASRHQITTELVRKHKHIAVEDINVSNMTKSAKGTIASPGKNVKAKSGLNREMLRVGFSEIRRQLEYKSEGTTGTVTRVDPKHTSQICSACGHKDKNNRTSQANFTCVSCGHSENADLNAAKNIRDRALNV